MSRKIELIDCGGHIRITGQVICKLWLHPKATIGFASQAVKQDLIRSLAARLEMHWDSLTEEEHGSPEGRNHGSMNFLGANVCRFRYQQRSRAT